MSFQLISSNVVAVVVVSCSSRVSLSFSDSACYHQESSIIKQSSLN